MSDMKWEKYSYQDCKTCEFSRDDEECITIRSQEGLKQVRLGCGKEKA